MSSTQPVPALPNPEEGTPGWLKALVGIGGLVVGGLVVYAAFSSSGREARRSPRLPNSSKRLQPLSPGEQLARNRKRGERFEDIVGERLQYAFPKATVISQLTVSTPEGKRRRLDYALAHQNGSVTPIEVKNVSALQEKHVKQAEDHRAGLKHLLNVRAGLPIVAVPEHTVVSEEHEARVRVVRVEASSRKSSRRKR